MNERKERKEHEGFVDGTEQFLAAVWYAMKDAEAAYAEHQRRGGRMPRWWYLNKIRKALGMESRSVSYSVMRVEMLEFVTTFGVDGLHPDAPTSPQNQAAMKEFQ